MPPCLGSSIPRNPEDADSTLFRNVGNYLPVDTTQHLRKFESYEFLFKLLLLWILIQIYCHDLNYQFYSP